MTNDLTTSKFNMWRGTIAIAHVDGVITDIEKEWLAEHLAPISLSDEQKIILENDLENGISLDELLPLITDRTDRAHLLHFANTLFRKDGFAAIEKKQYKILTDKIIGQIDVLSAMKEMEMEKARIEEIQKAEDNEFRGFFKYLISFIEKR